MDDLTLDALPAALRAADNSKVAFLLAARVDDSAPGAFLTLRSRIGHDLPGREVMLEPLSDAEVEELVAASGLKPQAEERARLVRRLRKEAAGTPLFLVEILRALSGATEEHAVLWPRKGETTAQPLPFKVPGAVVAALALRSRALSPPAGEALLAAAILGPRVDAALLAAVLNRTPDQVEAQLTELERAGFLRDEGGPYHFNAEIVRATLGAEMLTAGERRRLHQRAAQELERRGQADCIEYAEHRFGAGDYAAALELASRLKAGALERGLTRLAQRAERLEAKAAPRAGGL
jgi:predicted ATPase